MNVVIEVALRLVAVVVCKKVLKKIVKEAIIIVIKEAI